jgi:hypothetical protein
MNRTGFSLPVAASPTAMKKLGVPLTPAACAWAMSLRMSAANLPAPRQASSLVASNPTAAACEAVSAIVRGLENKRSRISQYLPCSAAQRTVSAARKAALCSDSSGRSMTAYFTLPVRT